MKEGGNKEPSLCFFLYENREENIYIEKRNVKEEEKGRKPKIIIVWIWRNCSSPTNFSKGMKRT